MVKRKRKFKTVKWTELEQGDCIKIIGGHGPSMIINNKSIRIGVPSGDYVVRRLNSDGIVARGKNGYCFIYMGPSGPSMLGRKEPHKFKKYLTKPNSLV